MLRSDTAGRPAASILGRAGAITALVIGLVITLSQGAIASGPQPMTLGVQTHFSQGWPLSLMDKVAASGAPAIRDGMPWASIETAPGVYRFPGRLDAYLAAAKARRIRVILTIQPTNRLYDAGQFVRSPEGRKAFANFVVAVLDHYGDTASSVEVANEINTKAGMPGVPMQDRPQVYAHLLTDVYPTIKAKHPGVAILGASTNVIGTGFLDGVFKAGGLAGMDGVVVHPYRSHAEGVDGELAHLDGEMAKYGAVRPIYATEFGSEVSDARRSAPLLIKMVAEMAATRVTLASWYALQDEPFFRNMGLYAADGGPKPAQGAFRMMEAVLAKGGGVVRVDAGDDNTFVYRFGADQYVMWGDGRPIRFEGSPRVRDSFGAVIPTPTRLSDDPIVVDGQFTFKLGPNPVLADSLYGYGGRDWRYFAKTSDGVLHPLERVDWEWTSYMGGKWYKPLRINADALAPAGDGAHPIQAVERFTATHDGRAVIQGAFSLGGSGDGVDLHVLHNGREIYGSVVTKHLDLPGLTVDLHKGDTLDFSVGPNKAPGGDSTSLRIRILASSPG
jgi:hypothetical protein